MNIIAKHSQANLLGDGASDEFPKLSFFTGVSPITLYEASSSVSGQYSSWDSLLRLGDITEVPQ